jgi:4-amino-4-deoxy-L-arabinose transferase-like glycosyltransferase
MSGLQTFVHALEEGRGRIFLRLGALAAAVGAILLFYDFSIYRGLNDAQSMDNAQLARQIARGDGFNTEFIRPYAIAQLNANAALSGSGRLFHAQEFPNGIARLLPDTYNAPGYPCLLAAWFEIFRPAFDERVAWLALLAFLLSDIVWQYSITALSTSLLMFFMTAMLVAALEIFFTGERREEDAGAPLWPAWLWTLALAVLLGAACLTRLHLLVMLFPLGLFLIFAPRHHLLFVPIVVLVTLAMVAPWFWHLDEISGHLFGSNGPLLHQGIDPYAGDQVYRMFQPVPDEGLFSDATEKMALGFNWHLVHAWELLGSSPLVLLFVASLLHHFRRRRAQALRFFLAGTALCLIAANSLGDATPAAVDAWNVVIILFPGMLVAGAAYFFVLVDRLEFEARLLNTVLAVVLLALTAIPLAQTILKGGNGGFNYPPYVPSFLRYMGGVVKPETWITTDMPWAVAWYGDHGALWLPDKMKDFDTIYDEFCPSGVLLLTPLTLDKPASNLLTGEDADWLPMVVSPTGPEDFPLNVRAKKLNIDYIIWSSH